MPISEMKELIEDMLERLRYELKSIFYEISPRYRVEIHEEADTYKIIIDLPGFDRNMIYIEAFPSKVIIKAENKELNRRADIEIPLPSYVDYRSGNAKYVNGVLTITFRKIRGIFIPVSE